MASYRCNSLHRVTFVSFEILALFSGTYLWICKLLGINTEVSGIGCCAFYAKWMDSCLTVDTEH